MYRNTNIATFVRKLKIRTAILLMGLIVVSVNAPIENSMSFRLTIKARKRSRN